MPHVAAPLQQLLHVLKAVRHLHADHVHARALPVQPLQHGQLVALHVQAEKVHALNARAPQHRLQRRAAQQHGAAVVGHAAVGAKLVRVVGHAAALAVQHERHLLAVRRARARRHQQAAALAERALVVHGVALDAHALPAEAAVEEERVGQLDRVVGRHVHVHAAPLHVREVAREQVRVLPKLREHPHRAQLERVPVRLPVAAAAVGGVPAAQHARVGQLAEDGHALLRALARRPVVAQRRADAAQMAVVPLARRGRQRQRRRVAHQQHHERDGGGGEHGRGRHGRARGARHARLGDDGGGHGARLQRGGRGARGRRRLGGGSAAAAARAL
ncbi:hypothetical protein FGB62_305g012 [Gracilaria domingensis]|nr:hypothetical protein FGB62_305g012 [Gracilaria domingensis]